MHALLPWWPIHLFALCSLWCLVVYAVDKRRARRGSWRIPEARLLTYSILGPAGAIIGVFYLRHKSRKLSYLKKLAVALVVGICGWLVLLYLTLPLPMLARADA